jgi:hypothetical protein
MSRVRQLIVLWAAAALFAAGCLLIAARADAWLAPAPRFENDGSPLTINGERLLDCLPLGAKSIEPLPDGVRLFTNLDLLFDASTAEPDGMPLFIVARGTPLDGIWPLVGIEVDRKPRESFFVTSGEWGLYRVELALPPGMHRFRISYLNDRSRFPTNRDMDISLIALGAPPENWESLLRWRKESLLPAGRFSSQLFAEPEWEGVRLRHGGSLADDIYYPVGGRQRVLVVAEAAGEKPGRLALHMDGKELGEIEIAGEGKNGYRVAFDLPAGLRRLELVNRRGEVVVHYLMADGAAPLPPSTGDPLPLGKNLFIPARMFIVEAEGRLQPDGSRLLWSNGRVGRRVTNADARLLRMTVVARGEPCEGVGPRMLLMAGDDQLVSVEVEREEFRPYSVDLKMAPGVHDVMAVYTNDLFVPGLCDRNLYIREIRLEEMP